MGGIKQGCESPALRGRRLPLSCRIRAMVLMVARRLKDAPGHIVVDSQGLLIGVLVTQANASELLGAVVVLHEAAEELSRLEVVWVDLGYSGENFAQAVKQVCGEQVRVEVIERISKAFERLPKRWIVERTFGWLNRFRRLSKDYHL